MHTVMRTRGWPPLEPTLNEPMQSLASCRFPVPTPPVPGHVLCIKPRPQSGEQKAPIFWMHLEPHLHVWQALFQQGEAFTQPHCSTEPWQQDGLMCTFCLWCAQGKTLHADQAHVCFGRLHGASMDGRARPVGHSLSWQSDGACQLPTGTCQALLLTS